jgi:hypothetical protein
LSSFATRSNIIIGIHINIHHHFLLFRNELLGIGLFRRRQVEDSSDINFMRYSINKRVLKFFGSLETKVSAIDVICESE